MATKILAVDQGTSSSRAILFNVDGSIDSVFQKPIEMIYPQDGWVENNPQELVDNTVWAIEAALSQDGLAFEDVAAMGISNQRETVVVWDKKTGEAVYNAIVWQDRRTAEYCATLKRNECEDLVREKTGLLLDPYFSATKIHWILENVEGARARAEAGDLLFGTVDSFLIWHLTKGEAHVTDVTNASRTMLYDIIGQEWSEKLFNLFDIPKSMAPDVRGNISDFGRYNLKDSDRFISIGGVAGDQQSALIGQGCLSPGMVKSTYGTGCFALTHMGEDAKLSDHKLLTTIASKIDGKVTYALEGAIFNAGTALQFLRDNLGLFEDVSETHDIAVSAGDNGGVYFVPAFTGLGAPFWKPDARGMICGLSRNTTKDHIIRAALEAQAYQTRDLIHIMQEDSGVEISELRVDGGLVANDFMCQFLSDMLQVSVAVPVVSESTAWGAACLAGVSAGVYESLDDAAAVWSARNVFKSTLKEEDADELYNVWKQAVDKLL